jgi:hypothetical protein
MLDRSCLAMVCTSMLVALVGGCGGGGSPVSDAGTSTVVGVVYLPADGGTMEVAMADGSDAPKPAANCQVTCTRERDRRRLRTTTTDGQGRYRFEGLSRGQEVSITADLPNGEQLRTRLRLRNQIHRMDISEGTATRVKARQ